MKKKWLPVMLVAACVSLSAAVAVGCKDNSAKTYTVVYDEQGGTNVKDGKYTVGEAFSMPTPTAGDDLYGYKFTGWYYDEACTKKVDRKNIDMSYLKDGKFTFYAGWSNVHTIYFDTKTSQLIEAKNYAYGDVVPVAELPTPDPLVIGDRTCEFVCWVQLNNGRKIESDFKMQEDDLYFYALYNTGVNEQFQLTEEGYVPAEATAATTVDNLTLDDNEAYCVDVTLPADPSEYNDDCGLVFGVTDGTFDGNSFDGVSCPYIVLFISAGKTSSGQNLDAFGALDVYGTYDKDGSQLFGRLTRFNFEGVLAGTAYQQKMNAYKSSYRETTFTFSVRRVGDTWYIGVDGVEYGTLTIGKNHTSGAGPVSSTLTGNVVGLRTKSTGIIFDNMRIEDASQVQIALDAGEGVLTETVKNVDYDTALGDLPTPTREGYDFDGWYYLSASGTPVDLSAETSFDKTFWKVTACARWSKQGGATYAIAYDTGCEDYTVDGVAEWKEGNPVFAPTLERAFYTYSGEWYYDEARTVVADLDNLDVSKAVDGTITLYAGYTYTASEFTNSTWINSDGVYSGTGNTVFNGVKAGVGDTLLVDVTLPAYDSMSYAASSLIFGAKDTNVWYRLVILGNDGKDSGTHGAVQLYHNTSFTSSAYSVRRMNGTLSGTSYNTAYDEYMAGGETLTVTLGVIIEEGVFHCLVNGVVVYSYEAKLEGQMIGFGSTTANAVSFSNVRVTKTTTAVNFDTQGGTMSDSATRTVVAGEAIGTLPVPEKDGYVFGGWYYVSESGAVTVTEATSFSATTREITLCALWNNPEAKHYAVEFNTGVDGYTVDGIADWADGSAITPPTLSATFHTFTGNWYYDEECTQLVDLSAVDASKATLNGDGTAIVLYAESTVNALSNSAWTENNGAYTGGGETLVSGYTLGEGQTLSVDVTLPAYSTSHGLFAILFGAKDLNSNDYYSLRILGNTESNAAIQGAVQLYLGSYTNGTFAGADYSIRRTAGALAGSSYDTGYAAYMTSGETFTFTMGVSVENGVFRCIVNDSVIYSYNGSLNGSYIGFASATANTVSFSNIRIAASVATVTLDAGEGTLPEDSQTSFEVEYGKGVGALPTPTLSGKEFTGWYWGDKLVTEGTVLNTGASVTLEARYAENGEWDGGASAALTGSGTEADPYVIATAADLKFLAVNGSGEAYASAYYKMTADIDLQSKEWTAVSGFKGVFDGGDYKIENLVITSGNTVGLFSTLDGATVKNLTVYVNIMVSGATVGGIAGKITGATTLENCTVYGSVQASNDVGGIVGTAGSTAGTGTIKNCVNYATVTSTSTGVGTAGGIVGAIVQSTVVNVEKCTNNGEIIGAGNFIGGIVGLMRAGGSTVADCYNFANITGNTNVGGVVGCNRSTVTTSYCLGTATVTCKNLNEVYRASEMNDTMSVTPYLGYLTGRNEGEATATGGLCDENGDVIMGVNITLWLSDTETKTLTAEAGALVLSLLPTPEKEGYKFLGWYYDDVKVDETTSFSAGEVTLRALWAADGEWDGSVSESLSGTGTEAEPYLLASGSDLAFLSANIASTEKDYASAYYKVTANINLNQLAWTPIGTAEAPFKGVFDGNGMTISSLAVSSSADNKGLFGYIHQATIKDLTVSGSVSGGNCVALIVGRTLLGTATANNVLSNLTAEGSVGGVSNVAGIIGYVTRGTEITNCVNKAEIIATKAGNAFAGGIVGSNDGGVLMISGCSNYGTVTAENGTFVGGIVGLARKATGASITNCRNYANVTGKTGGSIGGIVGTSRVALENCYVLGTATVNGTAASALELNGNYTGDKADSTKANVGAVVGQVDISGGASEPVNCGLCDEEGNPLTEQATV